MAQDVRIDRNKYIGGSDIPVIMGISPFKKRFDLLLEKVGIQENEFEGNIYTEYGNVLEPKIREYINSIYNTNFIEDKKIIGDLRSHVDGFDGKGILEIKTTSQIHNKVDDYKIYLVQLLFYMWNYDVETGLLAVYKRPEDFNEEFNNDLLTIYEININDYKDLLENIFQAIEQFRMDLERLKENPFLTEEELQPKELIELSNKVVELENKLASYKELEKQYKEFKQKLFEAMERKGVKKWETNNGVKITMVESTPDTTETIQEFNSNKFKEENPDLYSQYLENKETTKKGKSGYVKITLPKVK